MQAQRHLYQYMSYSMVCGTAKGKEQTMSDSISRQAAIDAVSETLKGVFVEYRDVAEKTIKKVPSAQPEQRWIPCSER